MYAEKRSGYAMSHWFVRDWFKARGRWLAVIALMAALAGVGGCNTVEGFGQDLQRLGDSLSRSAEQANDSEGND